MSGYSMYDTLMSLPLFKGAGEELVTAFIEKTHFDFKIFEAGEGIGYFGDDCTTLRCLLSGRMEVVHPMYCGHIRVREEVTPGYFMGVERLFGLDNRLPMTAYALDRCGTMEISKARYMELLASDQVYLLNCLNYLSRAAQKYEDILAGSRIGSFTSLLADLVEMATWRRGENISISSVNVPIMEFLPRIMAVSDDELDLLISEDIIEISSDYKIDILDRQRLIAESERRAIQFHVKA